MVEPILDEPFSMKLPQQPAGHAKSDFGAIVDRKELVISPNSFGSVSKNVQPVDLELMWAIVLGAGPSYPRPGM